MAWNICSFVKADVGGFGSTVLAPALKDVPVLSKILPDSGNITASESTETAGYTIGRCGFEN